MKCPVLEKTKLVLGVWFSSTICKLVFHHRNSWIQYNSVAQKPKLYNHFPSCDDIYFALLYVGSICINVLSLSGEHFAAAREPFCRWNGYLLLVHNPILQFHREASKTSSTVHMIQSCSTVHYWYRAAKTCLT